MTNIVVQLVNIYITKENWHKTKLSPKDAKDYFRKLIKDRRIIQCTDKGKLIGYVESWRVNEEQLRRLRENKPFHIQTENITDGDICYVSDLYIDKDYRGRAINSMKKEFFKQNKDCKYFTGEEVKRHRRWRVRRNKI